jgi:hypothetical protein
MDFYVQRKFKTPLEIETWSLTVIPLSLANYSLIFNRQQEDEKNECNKYF